MYRPDQRRSCCPHYTIRLDSSQFKPSRDQRQTINRFNRYVMGETYTKEVARLHPKSRDQAKKRDNHFDLIERVHEAEDAQLLNPPEAAHKLVVTLETDDFTEEKFEVYENYQRVVHKEGPSKITAGGFKRFLCSSPLRRETMVDSNGKERRLGSYHHCYRLDGKLLGALYEIALSIEEGYGWWYPGFYIHSCPKMRYKIDYSPQFILDPNSLTWDPLDRKMLDLLDKKAFVSLSLEKQRDNKSDVESEGSKSGDDEDDWLFNVNMPGIPPLSSVADWDLDNIALKIRPDGPLYKTSNLVIWDKRGVEDYPGLKAGVAELVAAVGPDLIDRICLDFTPRRG
ncbi:uncharacterized protein NECHADRAFT_93290 [Fusarium vanettenii 77-13-4]|uniref:arginyltransferase n=1 Tax=Fusarium vanettenii (strain ATCC MYA-4622 / CBS 123669 / FGSC 9596 / NRRL 45880 / 77-13-4) TaxID=660122 RepID=C7Z0U2_FUSV7|nr:uncharacterized protein NECHADRAFT_93290 [Fusarium vanettenii 77-13-4]EEU42442.1 predicted protein [Fusarium vanettenii 77-13-4]